MAGCIHSATCDSAAALHALMHLPGTSAGAAEAALELVAVSGKVANAAAAQAMMMVRQPRYECWCGAVLLHVP